MTKAAQEMKGAVQHTELLNCPFCGGEDISTLGPTCKKSDKYNPSDRAFPKAVCGKCYAEACGDNWDHTKKTAVIAWNTRSSWIKVEDQAPPFNTLLLFATLWSVVPDMWDGGKIQRSQYKYWQPLPASPQQ